MAGEDVNVAVDHRQEATETCAVRGGSWPACTVEGCAWPNDQCCDPDEDTVSRAFEDHRV